MVVTTNNNYANSSSNYYVIMLVQNLKNSQNRKCPIFSHFGGTKCRVEANNNRKTVVVCVKHVVKLLSMPSGLYYII